MRFPILTAATLALAAATLVPAAMTASAQTAAAPAAGPTIGEIMKQPAGADDPILAKVNDRVLKRSDILAALGGLPPQVQQMPMATVYPILLDRLIEQQLIAAAGRAAHLENDPTVKKRVADFEDRSIEEAYLRQETASRTTDAELRARYEKSLKDSPAQEEIHARHILVKTEAEAIEIIAALKKGGDFVELAKAKSTDGSAKEGGDLGFFGHDDMVPEFADAAFALKPGEITQTPVKTQFGFHVIKLEERRKSAPPSFEDSKPQIAQDLQLELTNQILDKLKGGAKIERFDFDGKPLPAPTPKP